MDSRESISHRPQAEKTHPTGRVSIPHDPNGLSSRLPGFYELPLGERALLVQKFAGLSEEQTQALRSFGALSGELTDVFIENAVGTFSMPLGIATNFKVNGREVLVPMAVEETSVLAAASHGAKLARAGGGFTASATEPIMTGQVQIYPYCLDTDFDAILTERKADLLAYANRGQDRLLERGGGAKDIDWRFIPEIQSLVLHIHIDTREAMGANIVNTMCERVSAVLPEIIPCDIGLRILTNYTAKRLARASCVVPASAFDSPGMVGTQVVERIAKAHLFAVHDVCRATTHNKGVMNGIDPVVIATGNDWRAVEAGAHAWAARSGTYQPLTLWERMSDGNLFGRIEIPLAVGIVGGVTKLHPTAQAALKLLGSPTAQELAQVIVSVGLAQNLSALRALASEGIQRGHMSLHQKNLELLARQGTSTSDRKAPTAKGSLNSDRKGGTRQ